MATNYSHYFLTFLGLPPDTTEAPICGANLPADWSGQGAPECPECLAEAKRRGLL
jgi:hypothetical protein